MRCCFQKKKKVHRSIASNLLPSEQAELDAGPFLFLQGDLVPPCLYTFAAPCGGRACKRAISCSRLWLQGEDYCSSNFVMILLLVSLLLFRSAEGCLSTCRWRAESFDSCRAVGKPGWPAGSSVDRGRESRLLAGSKETPVDGRKN